MTDSKEHKFTNKLIGENSPYLLSHAHNPVNWYPWGEEALAKAKAEDKPIFLSIGYAACHWCHVMERESFENEAIAELLNENFVAIKVDREQRPDLDNIYMTFTQAMTGHGGWPMSVFLTPDLKAFFAGTYFPPDDLYGRPGFRTVLTEIARAYREEKSNILESSDDIFQKVTRYITNENQVTALPVDALTSAAKLLMRQVDDRFGGLGNEPKFPHALEMSLFLRYYKRSGDLSYLQAAEKALTGMANGGIYDHVGGGFARYSVDRRWLVPHFEKMLYDNALLVPVYAEAWQITGNEKYRQVIRQTLDYILREMTDNTGGFYSALDADSEGVEGKFYVWTPDEIKSVLGNDAELFMMYYNVTEAGNFEGKNILNITPDSERVKQDSGRDDFDEFLTKCRGKLLKARSHRVRPLTDDKILTSWNGLAVYAFCKGFQVTGDERYLAAAVKNAEFVIEELCSDNTLTHAYRDGKHLRTQFLEDYAYYIRGLLALYESDTSDDNYRWLELAVKLADRSIEHFQDDSGVFYLREADQTDLIVRPRDEHDGSFPAPGSVMIENLFRLGRIVGKDEYTQKGELRLKALADKINSIPTGMASALQALDFYLNDKIEIVVVGGGKERDGLLRQIYRTYLPNRIVAVSSDGKTEGAAIPLPLFEGRQADGDGVKVYICRNSTCKLPVSTLEDLQAGLKEVT